MHEGKLTAPFTALVLVLTGWVAPAISAPVALVGQSPDALRLAECIGRVLAVSGRVIEAQDLVEGLEFRIVRQASPGTAPAVIITGLLKPDMGTLMQSHDNDPEAQPAANERFFALLRVHIGTRTWIWERGRESLICNEAAAWIKRLRDKPILLDRLGRDGETH